MNRIVQTYMLTRSRRMITGPRVDVYVGTVTKKHYDLLQLLLSHYSTYFAKLLQLKKEMGTAQQPIYLPEETIDDWEILLEYMLHGSFPGSIKTSAIGDKEIIKRCIDFLKFAEKYGLGAASDAIYEPLKKVLEIPYHPTTLHQITASEIEVIFRVVPAESRLRALAAQCVLSTFGIKGLRALPKSFTQINGFAAELLYQVVFNGTKFEWNDPLVTTAGYSYRME
jgi:hypothetical protein